MREIPAPPPLETIHLGTLEPYSSQWLGCRHGGQSATAGFDTAHLPCTVFWCFTHFNHDEHALVLIICVNWVEHCNNNWRHRLVTTVHLGWLLKICMTNCRHACHIESASSSPRRIPTGQTLARSGPSPSAPKDLQCAGLHNIGEVGRAVASTTLGATSKTKLSMGLLSTPLLTTWRCGVSEAEILKVHGLSSTDEWDPESTPPAANSSQAVQENHTEPSFKNSAKHDG